MNRRSFLAATAAAGHAAPGAAAPPPLESAVRMHRGRPALFVNGAAHDGLFCSVRSTSMKSFIEAGYDIFDALRVSHGWTGDGEYDYTKTDASIESFLAQKPDALLILRCAFGSPRNFWWVVKHEQERAVPKVRDKGLKMPSFASLRWRKEAGEALRRFVAHVEGKYGNRVIGYLPDSGEPGEWFERFAYTEDAARFTQGYEMGDYSAPMQRAYRRFVRARYGTIEAVNRAYGGVLASFDDLTIPEPDRRLSARHGNLRSAARDQALFDFYEALNRQVLETLLHYARLAKEACAGRKIVLAFYGYLFVEQARGGICHARSGHVHLDEVLSCPDIDGIVAPYHYDFRQLEGVMSSQSLAANALRRNKLFLHECDGSTYLKPCWPCEDHHNPANARESGNLLRRDLTKALSDGAAMWFMDLRGGMYDSPEMVAELKQALAAGRRLYWDTGVSDRQAAVVLSSRDAYYYREDEPLRALMISQFRQHALECMGLGYDDLTLETLARLDPAATAQYKFWIFPAAVRLSGGELETVRRHCCRNGNHVLWIYAPAALDGGGIDLDRARAASGFDLGCTMEAGELAVRTLALDHPFLLGRKSPVVYGTYGEPSPDFLRYHSSLRHYPGSDTGFRVTPRFYIRRADVVLGRMPDLEGDPAGLGIRRMGGWTSVLSAAPMVPRHLLRNIARAAGCHVFTGFPGQTYHCAGHVGFFAHDTGDCRIEVPFPARVEDAFTRKPLGSGVESVTLPVKINDTLFLRYDRVG